jgi:hypothetical protein
VTDRTTLGCSLERGATGRRLPDGPVNSTSVDCTTGWADAVAHDRPDVVFVSLVGQFAGDTQLGGQWVHPCDPAYDQWFGRQVVEGLSLLTRSGARVALALPARSFGGEFARRGECIRAVERQAASAVPGSYTADFEELVCPQGHCVGVVDGITLREDGVHYVGPAAELVVRWLVPRLRVIAAAPPP